MQRVMQDKDCSWSYGTSIGTCCGSIRPRLPGTMQALCTGSANLYRVILSFSTVGVEGFGVLLHSEASALGSICLEESSVPRQKFQVSSTLTRV